MARHDAAVAERWAGGERQRRLSNELIGMRVELGCEPLDLGSGRVRADQHAIAARAIHFLDHQFGQVPQHIAKCLGLAAAPGGHVLDQRIGAGVEAHDLRHIAVDRLVVGNPGADRIGDGEVARRMRGDHAGNAQHRVRPKDQRVEKGIVHAAVKHVDPLRALRRAHEEHVVAHFQVRPLDQLDPQLVG